jgi:hypothetical protein
MTFVRSDVTGTSPAARGVGRRPDRHPAITPAPDRPSTSTAPTTRGNPQPAERVAEHTAAALPGETVETSAGEANVGLAIRDALATFPADEIVVAVRPNEEEGLVESHVTDSAPQHSLDGVPVRYVVIPD